MNDSQIVSAAEAALRTLQSDLLARFTPDRPWVGRLSSSAVATALAVSALHRVAPDTHSRAIRDGRDWLTRTQREDGGWGDTPARVGPGPSPRRPVETPPQPQSNAVKPGFAVVSAA